MLETMKQLDSQLMMRNYEGFLQLSAHGPGASRASCCSASKVPARARKPTRLARALRRRAPLDRRHVPRAGGAGHRVRPRGQALHGRGRARSRRDRRRRDRGVPRARRSARRRLRARRVPPHAAPGAGARPGARRPRRSTSRSTSTCRARSCSTGSPAGASARTASACTTSTCRPTHDWTCDTCGGHVVPARRRHRGGDRPPARALRAARRSRSSTTTASSGHARAWSTGWAKATRCSSGSSRSSTTAACVRSRPGGPAQDAARRSRMMRTGGRGRRRDARGVHPRGEARRDDRRSRPAAREVLDRAARPLELPRLPRLPGRRLHLAQRGDRARHPRRPACSKTATSSRSTAARSSRAGTPTPRSRCRSATIDDESQRLIDVTRASLEAAIAATIAGNRLGDIGAAVEGVVTGGRVRGRAGVRRATASAPRCTRSPTSRTTGRAGRGLRAAGGHGARDRADGHRRPAPPPGSSTTAGPS